MPKKTSQQEEQSFSEKLPKYISSADVIKQLVAEKVNPQGSLMRGTEKEKIGIIMRDGTDPTEKISFKSGLLDTPGAVLINRNTKQIYKVLNAELTAEEKKEMNHKVRHNQGPEIPGVIGRGSNKIKLCQNIDNGNFYAVKGVRKTIFEQWAFYATFSDYLQPNEAKFLQTQLLFIDLIETDKKYYFISKIIDGESLDKYILKINELFKQNPSEAMTHLLNIFLKMIEKLDYFHSQGFLHRDIKPDNFMYEPATGEIVLIDFGLSAYSSLFNNAGLTFFASKAFHFVAPEIRDSLIIATYSKASDLYSLGKTFEYLVHRLTIPNYANFKRQFDSLLLGRTLIYKSQDRADSSEIKSIINKLQQIAKEEGSHSYKNESLRALT